MRAKPLSPYEESFRLRLRQVLLARRLTTADLARMIGTSYNTARAIKHGWNSVGWEVACRIAEALDVPLDSFRRKVDDHS